MDTAKSDLGGQEVRFGAANGRRPGRELSPADEQRRRAAIALIERYDSTLRRTARRFSLCADDADDAYQRAMEIALMKAPDVPAERLVRWMHTVTRHEAYAVRRQRERLLAGNHVESVDGAELDIIDLIPSDAPEPDVGAERSERVARGFEALRSLKPQEVRTLTLKAEGYSYEEIREITGFSLTKINRCMVEGRRRFLDTFAAIEEGQRCDELSPLLSAFSDGETSAEEQPDLIEHLRGCAHCRAKLREYRRVPKRVLGLAPVAMMGGPSVLSRASDRLAAAGERTKEVATSVLHRGGGTAVDASQTVAAGGGTRGTGLAVIGVICGLGAAGGGAAVCLEQGVLPSPVGGGPAQVSTGTGPEPALAPVTPAETVVEPAPSEVSPTEPAPKSITPTQQKNLQLGFERSAPAPEQSSPSSEFGAGVSSGGGSGGSSAGGASGFGFEK